MQGEKENNVLELNDVFEYDVVSVLDMEHGGVDVDRLNKVITSHASEGWRLISMFSNEVGHNSTMSDVDGVSVGINATADQNILVFERCVHRYDRGSRN